MTTPQPKPLPRPDPDPNDPALGAFIPEEPQAPAEVVLDTSYATIATPSEASDVPPGTIRKNALLVNDDPIDRLIPPNSNRPA